MPYRPNAAVLQFGEDALARLRMLEDAFAHLPRQIQPLAGRFEQIDDAHRLLVVTKPLRQQVAERLLARMAEWRVPQIVGQRDGFGEIVVEPQRTGNGTRDLRHLDAVCQARAEQVAFMVEEDLGLPQDRKSTRLNSSH